MRKQLSCKWRSKHHRTGAKRPKHRLKQGRLFFGQVELSIYHICSLVGVSIDIADVEARDRDEQPEHPLVMGANSQVNLVLFS